MSAKKKSLAICNKIGTDNFSRNSFKSWGATQIKELLMKEATNMLKISMIENLARYTIISCVVSSTLSGWY